ncbi:MULTISPECIES: class I SAM-dependent methyltransferase [Paenibacillus]|uniref:Class I SAM-dependent methyltransferase n=1 Tax=Paenibacillus timonensis TaxID=225915 RepID=A0ABW3SJ63_9BACL|nr:MULTISPECIES: class I SAM-dependent methyltransferase [Paenibacillus]KHF32268.1 Ubiquinone biosynthesis O-methyltransferase [Paenibacillus sp. P1XP2]MCH1642925.1 class I SAM-dependent methyltransferase [Paenibacillus timonensis]MEC2343742.1 class I SAM-dependent methyltransferase [Paenibacillus barengoltzii]
MDRVEMIRAEEKRYHDFCYEHYNLYEQGTWLHKPVQTVLDLIDQFNSYEYLRVLDLGSGVGRNSIPIAQTIKNRQGKVICVDLLESALNKLHEYSKRYEVEHIIEMRLSDIEQFEIKQSEYDLIIAVSALEHVSSERALEKKLREMVLGTTAGGINCIIISSNIREVNQMTSNELDPMFEINLSTERMLDLMDRNYSGWEIQKRIVKQLEFDIKRREQPVKLMSDCITYIAKRSR